MTDPWISGASAPASFATSTAVGERPAAMASAGWRETRASLPMTSTSAGSSQPTPVESRRMVYVAGDLSGIQAFVFGVKTAGKGQAKRLRARSFLVELIEKAALARVRGELSVAEQDILVQGGGGFLVRADGTASMVSSSLEEIQQGLERQLHRDTGAEIRISLGWGSTVGAARHHLEQRKRRAWHTILQNGSEWTSSCWHLSSISPPCTLCGRQRAALASGAEAGPCAVCRESIRLGDRLTKWGWMRPTQVAADDSVSALGVRFRSVQTPDASSFRVRRAIPRHRDTEVPMTFEELANGATGAKRLAVLKADVDDMGLRVQQLAAEDPTYRRLRAFSRDLHAFFSDDLHDIIIRSWPTVYTLFAGGDDLILVGPWDTIVEFAGALRDEFDRSPAQAYPGLTLSAGISFTPFRVPIRHSVKRAESLLESSKALPGKNRCSCLGATWNWAHHGIVLRDGKLLVRSIRQRAVSRSLVQRLLQLLEARTTGELGASRWNYQIERGVPRSQPAVHRWSRRVLRGFGRRDAQELEESAASIRYALLATRTSRGRNTSGG